jgi:hypothetical protein
VAYETIRGVLRREDISWVEPMREAWNINLQSLGDLIDLQQRLPWLSGSVRLKPEFTSEILSAGPPKVGKGDFDFYISQESIAEVLRSSMADESLDETTSSSAIATKIRSGFSEFRCT